MSIIVKIAGIKSKQHLTSHAVPEFISCFTVNAVFAGNHVNGIRDFLTGFKRRNRKWIKAK